MVDLETTNETLEPDKPIVRDCLVLQEVSHEMCVDWNLKTSGATTVGWHRWMR